MNTSPLIFDSDRAGFESDVVEASRTQAILVDFWADWCAPCHTLTPHLERLAAELGGTIRVAKVEVDVDDNMKLAGHYRLRGFPTVLLFHGGEERGRFSGSRSLHQLREWLQAHLEIGPAG